MICRKCRQRYLVVFPDDSPCAQLYPYKDESDGGAILYGIYQRALKSEKRKK